MHGWSSERSEVWEQNDVTAALKALDARPPHADSADTFSAREAVIPTKGIDYFKWDHLSIYSSDGRQSKRRIDMLIASRELRR